MSKEIKEKVYNVQIINIKLLSNNRSGDTAYSDIIKEIHGKKISIPVRGGKQAILRTQFNDKIKFKDKEYDVLYGKFSKYTVIDGKDWINIATMDVENVDIPPYKFPNLVESDYIFIPSAHRFVLVKTNNMKINTAECFFKESIKQVIASDEDFQVIVEQSEDVFDEIKNAEIVSKLLIKISYTNADLGDEAFEFMDNQLKDSQIGNIEMNVSPDHNKNINTNTTLITGALNVAQSNGYVEATIRNNGIKKKIETKMHPKVIQIKAQETLLKKYIFDLIMNLFRGNIL